MMQLSAGEWTSAEQQIAKAAFDKAYQRELEGLMEAVRSQAATITQVEDVWGLHDFLSAKRHEIDGKYDYQDTALIFVFAELVKDGLLQLDELAGLETSKLTKIAALARF
jgi:hypothetical protein